MTELEMQIIQTMRNASEENLARALAFLCQIELEGKRAVAPQAKNEAV